MAKVRPTSPWEDIRGRVGGLVFAANKSGTYVRRLSVPAKSASLRQTQTRTIFGMLSRLWGELPEATRDAWEVFALDPSNTRYDQWGNPFYLSGINWFLMINRSAQYVHNPLPAAVPAFPLPEAPPRLSVCIDPTETVGGSVLTALDPWPDFGAYLQVMLRIWPRPGQKSPPTPLTLLDILPIMDFASYPWDARILDVLGAQQPVGRYYLRLWVVSTEFRAGVVRDYTALLGTTIIDP